MSICINCDNVIYDENSENMNNNNNNNLYISTTFIDDGITYTSLKAPRRRAESDGIISYNFIEDSPTNEP